ncbi:hypothetical protein SynRS9902_02407 [Synechococcus sp. RS9902]|nr:hypothetical protein SynRS9902_02407 [Synechococcus sp. RS9902]
MGDETAAATHQRQWPKPGTSVQTKENNTADAETEFMD